jgi:hypothetical protein
VLLLTVGVLALFLGGTFVARAHAIHPVEVQGYTVAYTEILVNGAYARNELRLAGDHHTYILDRAQFHPPLPERFLKDGRIRIWVDRGTTHVVAVTLYTEVGLNPASYVTAAYIDPDQPFVQAEIQGGLTLAAGMIVVLAALIWLARPGSGTPLRLRRTSGTGQSGPLLAVLRMPATSADNPGSRWPPAPSAPGVMAESKQSLAAGTARQLAADEAPTLKVRTVTAPPSGDYAGTLHPPTASDPAEQPTLKGRAVPPAGIRPEAD